MGVKSDLEGIKEKSRRAKSGLESCFACPKQDNVTRPIPTPAFPCVELVDPFLLGAMPTDDREAFANHPACPRHTRAAVDRVGKKSRAIAPRWWRGRLAGSNSCPERWADHFRKRQSNSIRHPLRDREPRQHLPIARRHSRCTSTEALGYPCPREGLWPVLVGICLRKSWPCDSPDRLRFARSIRSDRRPRLKKRFRLRRSINQGSSSIHFRESI